MYSHQRYERILDEIVVNVRRLSKFKGGEYAGDYDRLANFRRNAEHLGLQMDQVWAVYAAKHWDAINQHIQDMALGRIRPATEPIQGRINDLIVYLVLYSAILDERKGGISGQNTGADHAAGEASNLYPPKHLPSRPR